RSPGLRGTRIWSRTAPPTRTPESTPSKSTQPFKSCWSCRVTSGGGLILAGVYVFNEGWKMVRRGPASLGTVAQLTFAASMVAFGAVVAIDPVGNMKRT
uniref:Distal membrane-arm assembly complex protein 1-like domain-containing protein n=1 Tax=Kryptolebias marmoratus TaxID=37003 RepID=A0A3Q2ZDZ7_KRYMA